MQDPEASPRTSDPGLGLIETAIIAALILVVVIAVLVLLGPPLLQQLSHFIARS